MFPLIVFPISLKEDKKPIDLLVRNIMLSIYVLLIASKKSENDSILRYSRSIYCKYLSTIFFKQKCLLAGISVIGNVIWLQKCEKNFKCLHEHQKNNFSGIILILGIFCILVS